MSLTFGFYNSIDGDRVYDAIQFGQIFDGIITDGIYATYLKAMVVKASDNASEVIVQPGRAWFNHTWTYIDADYPVEAPAPEVILDRVDALVLDINQEYSDRENKILWVQGTPASVNPEAPSLINTTTHHQYPLCNVYRKAGTTMIYAADITNRVGTSDTPFVTGVLTGINIDDLLSQWDDEFHTWENATKTSFEGWMVNQQSVYTTWFESIKTQMNDDLTSFVEWFETIRGIIDEEAATHLQAEIDELKDMLPAGSHIDISTNESTLFNRNVTVSDGVHSKTVQFNAVGGAIVESFPYIGDISVTSTDGERTAQETINIPYFGRYSVVLAFWTATVVFSQPDLSGEVVTIRNSSSVTVGNVTLDSSGEGIWKIESPDVYTFTVTNGGQTMSISLNVTEETIYYVTFIPTGSTVTPTDDIQTWLKCAGIFNKSYTTISQVLSDPSTVLSLITSDNAVDYMVRSTTWASDVCADSTAMTYIGLNDYCADTLLNDSTWLNAICNSTYFESVLNVKIPTMTSNTAPSGTVLYSSYYNNYFHGYYAFDGDSSTNWLPSVSATNNYIGYKFTKNVKVCMASIVYRTNVAGGTNNNKIQAYINSAWKTVIDNITLFSTGGSTSQDIGKQVFNSPITSDQFRLLIPSVMHDNTYQRRIETLQLYGRASS